MCGGTMKQDIQGLGVETVGGLMPWLILTFSEMDDLTILSMPSCMSIAPTSKYAK